MGPKTYNVTPAQMANFRAVAAQNGLSVPAGNAGQVETHGVVISFTYDGAAQLAITIMSKPWYVPASGIWGELEGFLPNPTA
jgi:hypothetical protein